MKRDKTRQLKQIYKYHLAVGSGVEDVISSSVRTELNEYGLYEPVIVTKNLADQEVDRLLQASLNSDESPSEAELAKVLYSGQQSMKHDDIIGYYLQLFAGHVNEGNYRSAGSSGGFASWLAVELLEQKKIDGFIHVVKSKKRGRLFEYSISKTAKDIRENAKSRYYPAELSGVLREVKETPGRYAIVGIPEVLSEVRLLSAVDPVIKERIKYYIGLVCGHQKSTKYAEAIAWEQGIKPGNLLDIDFREKQNSGKAIDYKMRMTGMVGGKKKSIAIQQHSSFVSNWGHGYFKAKFSDFTDNVFNEVADVVVGDAWLEEYVHDPKGTNILIVRNKEILTLLRSALTKRRVYLEDLAAEDIKRSQEGLIHHLRDELPYRLFKHRVSHSFTPKKRAEPTNKLRKRRRRVQDIRQTISRQSHRYYKQATEAEDFELFRKRMQKYVGVYDKLYADKVNTAHKAPNLKDTLKSSLNHLISMPRSIRERNADGAILSLTGYSNYGNVIQRYALQRYLDKRGYNFVSLCDSFHHPQANYVVPKKVIAKTPLRVAKRIIRGKVPYWYIPSIEELFPDVARYANLIRFANKNIWQKPFNIEEDAAYKNYIVGSDQIWRNWYGSDINEEKRKVGYYFLNFLESRRANRLAYAASFGKDKLGEVLSSDFIKYARPYAKLFNGISVREKSATNMIKEAWDIGGVEEVVDPTFLLSASDYSNLLKRGAVTDAPGDRLYYYILDMSSQKRELLEVISGATGRNFWGINPDGEGVLPPMEWWLKGFRDAEFVVTDSFHGTVFSIINETPFIVIGNEGRGLTRITDLLGELGLEQRVVPEGKLKNFAYSDLEDIDWAKIKKRLSKKIDHSSNWLVNHLVR